MCRSIIEKGDFSFYSKENRLKIRYFRLRFSISTPSPNLPETLTLIYLLRINGNPLEINGAKARADVPAFVALHRARSLEGRAEAVYASADRVWVGEAVRFEGYVGSEKAIKGVFRRSGGSRGLECKSEVDLRTLGVLGAEVLVGGERGFLMREKVDMESKRGKKKGFCLKLEEILEEGEKEGCDCCYCEEEEEEEEEEEDDEEREWEEEGEGEEEREGVKWAMEMGVWGMCVGVGYLVSKGLRRKRII